MAEQRAIVYRSKLHATLKRNFARLILETHLCPWRLARRFAPGETFQIMPGTKWLEMFLQHVPDRGEHLVRYYGWYSNRARGTRNAEMAEPEASDALIEGIPEQVDPEASRAARAAWARLIK